MYKLYHSLTDEEVLKIEAEVIMMLLTSRQSMSETDRFEWRFDAANGFYGEAFGIMRGLAIMGYGHYDGAVNTPERRTNLKWWFSKLEDKALSEEKEFGLDKAQEKYKKIVNEGYKTYLKNKSIRQQKDRTFKAGDYVEWISNNKVKRGEIIEVIPPHTQILSNYDPKILSKKYKQKFQYYSLSKFGSCSSRNHESYVVKVENQLYWPRVTALTFMEK